ncbi:4-hydroxyphenylpyruvate dioxygenase [Klebsiella pneumoniae subsp. ozaenae]|uniref:4-hydroxyphenylpyruvate dioxygenase n=1 Tax=Klebsiella pneumoniae subsp. ozaenae TaxID=574 RepID=A0A378BA17_KLEPO|nr:4-hydroxyphenylpyruvate dioxygenase [Klebsiella pneumoniae subsp. ozaenae]
MTVREDYLGIDHLALGMEADSRDNWVMFFRTVFGFSLEHEQTLPDPYGLVRSLAVRSPQGDIRLALNISQSRATQIARSVACYQGAGLQHAAFACRDLPAACDQLAEGCPAIRCRSRPIIMTICWRALAASWTSGSFSASSSSMTAIRRGGDFLHLYTRPFTAGRFSLS